MSMDGVPRSEVVNNTSGFERTRCNCQSATCHETFQHVERREQRFLRRNANSSFVQFGLGTGSETSRLGQVTDTCMFRCFHCTPPCGHERRSLHQDGCRHSSLDSEGFYTVDKALCGYRGPPRFWRENPQTLTILSTRILETSFNACTLTMNFSLEMLRNLNQKFFVKKDDFLTKNCRHIEIMGQKVERPTLEYRLITSSRYTDQSLKDMEKCNLVSTPPLQVTERFGDRGATSCSVGGIVSTSDKTTSPCCGTTARCRRSRERALTRHEFFNKCPLDTSETRHALLGE